MNMTDDAWEQQIEAVWKRVEELPPEELVEAIDALAAERGDDDAAALFERASARDTAGQESGAEGFYRAALAVGGLDPLRQARAVIQLASTLRILGQLDESEQLLTDQLDRYTNTEGEHPLHDETRAFLALTWVAQGRAVEAAGLALIALAPHLCRYTRSVSGNAKELLQNNRVE